MSQADFGSKLNQLKLAGFFDSLEINRGIEKESLRVNAEGKIASTRHPRALGSALTNPGLATALSFAPTTLSLENYWARVIGPIQQAPWYNTPRPSGQDMELWESRVAMLDAIYYEPPSK